MGYLATLYSVAIAASYVSSVLARVRARLAECLGWAATLCQTLTITSKRLDYKL